MSTGWGPRKSWSNVQTGGAIPDDTRTEIGTVVAQSTTDVCTRVQVYAETELTLDADVDRVGFSLFRGTLADNIGLVNCNSGVDPGVTNFITGSFTYVDELGPGVEGQLYTLVVACHAASGASSWSYVTMIADVF